MKLNECLYTENADQNSFVYIVLTSRTLLPDGIHIGVGGMGTTGLTPIYAALLATWPRVRIIIIILNVHCGTMRNDSGSCRRLGDASNNCGFRSYHIVFLPQFQGETSNPPANRKMDTFCFTVMLCKIWLYPGKVWVGIPDVSGVVPYIVEV